LNPAVNVRGLASHTVFVDETWRWYLTVQINLRI